MTTMTRTECEVADRILPWHEVCEGDAVLFIGRLRLVVAMRPAMIPDAPYLVGVRLLDGGETQDVKVNSDDLTAVRRYVETPAPGEGGQ